MTFYVFATPLVMSLPLDEGTHWQQLAWLLLLLLTVHISRNVAFVKTTRDHWGPSVSNGKRPMRWYSGWSSKS